MTTKFDMVCPKCGAENDAVSSPTDEEAVPSDGDITICMYCGHVVAFVAVGTELGIRALTDKEQAAVDADENIQRLLRFRAAVIANHVEP